MSSKNEILGRIRKALGESRHKQVEVPRNFLKHAPGVDPKDRATVVNLFEKRLQEYGAKTVQVKADKIAENVAIFLKSSKSVIQPSGLPNAWLKQFPNKIKKDEPPLTYEELNNIDAILSTCTVAVADSGTIILNTDKGQGRRAPTLLPDLHVCVVFENEIVSSMPEAINKLNPMKPTTYISGPSATADIEMIRVQGVHGPRNLSVILVKD